MWLNDAKVTEVMLHQHRQLLLQAHPNHVVIDGLFDPSMLDKVMQILHYPQNWQGQKHTYSALYVDQDQWQATDPSQRFVQRDVWNRERGRESSPSIAHDFLKYLRSEAFMAVLSRIFNVQLTDLNVQDPMINSNYFRLNKDDFVEQHADDSPGREVCLLLYLNQTWQLGDGGELVFMGDRNTPIKISPIYNRCVLFDPSSKGSEHYVEKLNAQYGEAYRYNVTSWYWSE